MVSKCSEYPSRCLSPGLCTFEETSSYKVQCRELSNIPWNIILYIHKIFVTYPQSKIKSVICEVVNHSKVNLYLLIAQCCTTQFHIFQVTRCGPSATPSPDLYYVKGGAKNRGMYGFYQGFPHCTGQKSPPSVSILRQNRRISRNLKNL